MDGLLGPSRSGHGRDPAVPRRRAPTCVEEAGLTAEEDKEYGGWKRPRYALGHFADIVEKNERDGYLTVGLLATCPSMPGLVAGPPAFRRQGDALKIGML